MSLANHLTFEFRYKKKRSERQAVDISTIKKYWEYNCQFLGEDLAVRSLEKTSSEKVICGHFFDK